MNTWVIALLIIAFLIMIHELGHFIAARLMGVRVEEFSIGFPPRILSKYWGHTRYSLGLLMIGGFVRMLGQNIEDENPAEKDNYAAKTPWQRMFIVLAGPLINITLAIIIMPLSFKLGINLPASFISTPPIAESIIAGSAAEKAGFSDGDLVLEVNNNKINSWQEYYDILNKSQQAAQIKIKTATGENKTLTLMGGNVSDRFFGITPLTPPIVGALKENWPAEIAGLKSGDRILKIDNRDINSLAELATILKEEQNKPLVLQYEREQQGQWQSYNTTIIARYSNQDQAWRLGFSAAMTKKYYNWIDSIKLGWNNIVRLNKELINFFKRLFTGNVASDEVGGPVMIVKVIGDSFNEGLSSLIVIVAFISWQLGVFNLLPLPVLDGGHVVFLILELITGKQPSAKTRSRIQIAGALLLLGLMVLVTIQDILRL